MSKKLKRIVHAISAIVELLPYYDHNANLLNGE